MINIDQFIYEFLKISENNSTNNEISVLYDNITALQEGKLLPKINLYDENNIINDIGLQINFNKKNIIVFWSYDQNAHQVNLFNKVNLLSMKYFNYHFNLININDNSFKWKNNYLNNFNSDKELLSTDRRYATEDYKDEGLIWIGGYYCKFEKGFEVGMKDHRGYFEITKVEI